MPFITEEIWQHIPHEGNSIMTSPGPVTGRGEFEDADQMELVMDAVRGIKEYTSGNECSPEQKASALHE